MTEYLSLLPHTPPPQHPHVAPATLQWLREDYQTRMRLNTLLEQAVCLYQMGDALTGRITFERWQCWEHVRQRAYAGMVRVMMASGVYVTFAALGVENPWQRTRALLGALSAAIDAGRKR